MAADTPRANDAMKMSPEGYAALRINEGVDMRYYNDAPSTESAHGAWEHWRTSDPAHLQSCSARSYLSR
ncbi:hypothetical protein QF001_001265 [Paraburkholderia youngii]